MNIDAGTILGIISILFTAGGIIFYAGSVPEKLKAVTTDLNRIETEGQKDRDRVEIAMERLVTALRRETEKAADDMTSQTFETTKRLHERIDKISVHLMGTDGSPVFVTKTECSEKRKTITEHAENMQSIICQMLERMEAKFEKATSEWAKSIGNQQTMLNEISLIKQSMKELRSELNGNRRGE
jgi:IS1 family transposase